MEQQEVDRADWDRIKRLRNYGDEWERLVAALLDAYEKDQAEAVRDQAERIRSMISGSHMAGDPVPDPGPLLTRLAREGA
jgi:hypothetical protein